MPTCPIGGRLIGALQKSLQQYIRIIRCSYGIIGKQKLTQFGGVKGGLRDDGRGAKASGRRIGIAVKRRIIEGTSTRPETGAANLLGVGLPGDGIRQIGNTAGMYRRRSSGKARHRQIKAAPEEVYGAAFALKVRC